jgi:hypothetical protein
VRLAFGLGPCGGAGADVCRTWPLACGLVLPLAEPCPGRWSFASAVANRGWAAFVLVHRQFLVNWCLVSD